MERIVATVREHLADFPLQLYDVMLACVESQGLAAVLEAIGEVYGNAGQRYFRIVRRRRIPYGDRDTGSAIAVPRNKETDGASPHLSVRTRRRGTRTRKGADPDGLRPARVRLPAVPRV
jgi:hypothetical protein